MLDCDKVYNIHFPYTQWDVKIITIIYWSFSLFIWLVFFSFLVRSWLNVTQRYFNPLQYLNVYWPIDFSFQLITRLSIQVEMCEMKCNHALRLEISCENPLHRNDNQNIFPVDRPLYRPVIWSWLNSNWFHSFIHSLLQACHFFLFFLLLLLFRCQQWPTC